MPTFPSDQDWKMRRAGEIYDVLVKHLGAEDALDVRVRFADLLAAGVFRIPISRPGAERAWYCERPDSWAVETSIDDVSEDWMETLHQTNVALFRLRGLYFAHPGARR